MTRAITADVQRRAIRTWLIAVAVLMVAPPRLRIGAHALLCLVLVQIYLGALVAGLDAGLTYNTWPLIDGQLVPGRDALFPDQPWWRNLFENRLTVQFDHRMAAYLLWLAAVLHAVDAARSLRRHPVAVGAAVLAVTVTLQAVLGILTLLQQVPIALALAHQGMALVVLTIAVAHAEPLTALRSPGPHAVEPLPHDSRAIRSDA